MSSPGPLDRCLGSTLAPHTCPLLRHWPTGSCPTDGAHTTQAYDSDERLRALPCDHCFHCECIDKWLISCLQARRPPVCPICKDTPCDDVGERCYLEAVAAEMSAAAVARETSAVESTDEPTEVLAWSWVGTSVSRPIDTIQDSVADAQGVDVAFSTTWPSAPAAATSTHARSTRASMAAAKRAATARFRDLRDRVVWFAGMAVLSTATHARSGTVS